MPKAVLVIIGIPVIIVVIVLIVSAIANTLFEQKVKKEVSAFFSNNVEKNTAQVIQKADLESLPVGVQKWLENSRVIGKERTTSARSKQKAVMRMEADKPWMPLEAKQYFTVDKPGYIWQAKVKAAPLLYIAARDKYDNGKGSMLIKFLALFKVADSKGKEIDQGSLVRYLAEIVWIPTAALSSYITWEEIDANSARATMSYAGVTASGVFKFNDRGEVINFVAPRYGDFDGQYALETWTTVTKDYKEFDGIRVPTRGEVVWKLKSGDFNWYRFNILDIEYNKPVVY